MEIIEIVNQLNSCNYQCEAGPLGKNTAFIELEKMAQKNEEAPETIDNTSSPKLPYDEVVTELEIKYNARKWSLAEWKAVRKTYDIMAGKIGHW